MEAAEPEDGGKSTEEDEATEEDDGEEADSSGASHEGDIRDGKIEGLHADDGSFVLARVSP
jgi:hypothetical protein